MKIGYPVFGGLHQPQDDQIAQGTNMLSHGFSRIRIKEPQIGGPDRRGVWRDGSRLVRHGRDVLCNDPSPGALIPNAR